VPGFEEQFATALENIGFQCRVNNKWHNKNTHGASQTPTFAGCSVALSFQRPMYIMLKSGRNMSSVKSHREAISFFIRLV